MKSESIGRQGYKEDIGFFSLPRIPKIKSKTNLIEFSSNLNLSDNIYYTPNIFYEDSYENYAHSDGNKSSSFPSSLSEIQPAFELCCSKKKNKVFEEFEELLKNVYMCSSQNVGSTKYLYIERSLIIMTKIPVDLSIPVQIEKKKKYLPPIKFKTTLCIDLDETLIYTDFSRKFENHDFVYEGEYGNIGINFRPGLNHFLKYISQHFEVVLFTASVKEYADKVLEIIDPNNEYFSSRFYREECIKVHNYFKIKDLRILANRSVENMILIDNNIINMYNQLENGYLISSFYNDKSDTELSKLQSFLESTSDVNLLKELKRKFEFKCKMDCLI